MHPNFQWIHVKVCPQKICEDIGGPSPTICGLFLLQLVKEFSYTVSTDTYLSTYRLLKFEREIFSTPGLGLKGSASLEWSYSTVNPSVPFSSPLTHVVKWTYPFRVIAQGYFGFRPPVRPKCDDNCYSRSHGLIDVQKASSGTKIQVFEAQLETTTRHSIPIQLYFYTHHTTLI